jgi:hypothetical protein
MADSRYLGMEQRAENGALIRQDKLAMPISAVGMDMAA